MPLYTSNLMPHLVKETGLTAEEICQVYSEPRSEQYKIYDIRQGKRGKKRTIQEPIEPLKSIQRALIPIFERYQLSPWCTAVRGGSAVLNAQRHIGARHILKVDIKSCYPSITDRMIQKGLELEHSTLKDYDDTLGAVYFGTMPIGRPNRITEVLPTGAPTSPILCNIALTPIDYWVIRHLSEHFPEKYIYSRYLDDMIFSTKEKNRDWQLLQHIKDLLECNGLKANTKKSKWMDARDDSMIVTGVHVFKSHAGVPRQFWRYIRSRLQHIAKEGKPLDEETKGCLAYIKSIDQKRHDSLVHYFERRQRYAATAIQ